jgi:hypothetical protein
MTHSDIVNIAYKWLLKNGRIGFAFKELKSLSQEIPDVIGFDSWQSTLIECKISRSDFLSDQKKTHRKKGMGNWRFYCCPKGLIKQKDLPPKWGLIYVDEKGRAQIEYDCRRKKIYQKCESSWDWERNPEGFYYRTEKAEENWFEADMQEERKIFYTALRRLHLRRLIETIYEIPEEK